MSLIKLNFIDKEGIKMAKKKTQYPNKTKSNIITVLIAAMLVALLFAVVAVNAATRKYIIKVDGVKIPKSYYLMHLYSEKIKWENGTGYGKEYWNYDFTSQGGPSATDVQKTALNATLIQRVSVLECKKLGLTLTDEQKEEA